MTTAVTPPPHKFEIFQPNYDTPQGHPFSTWVQRWWKWVLEIPASRNPGYGYNSYSAPPTSENEPYDSENVWFFAGAFNDGSLPHTRNLTYRSFIGIPSKKALLLPVINFFAVVRDQKHVPELEKRVKEEMDVINPDSLYVTIDGQRVSNLAQYRADTGTTFPITVDGKDNVVKLRHLFGRPINLLAKGDGYWLFLKPFSLTSGTHEIHSFGSCLEGKIQIEIHYKMEVI